MVIGIGSAYKAMGRRSGNRVGIRILVVVPAGKRKGRAMRMAIVRRCLGKRIVVVGLGPARRVSLEGRHLLRKRK
jgi:hypothetical protein